MFISHKEADIFTQQALEASPRALTYQVSTRDPDNFPLLTVLWLLFGVVWLLSGSLPPRWYAPGRSLVSLLLLTQLLLLQRRDYMHSGACGPRPASDWGVLPFSMCFSHFLGSFLHMVDTANCLGPGISILEFGWRCLETRGTSIHLTEAKANTSWRKESSIYA